jgi:hypothetical protein
MVFNITGGYLLTDSYIINEDQIITYTSPSVKKESFSHLGGFSDPLVFMNNNDLYYLFQSQSRKV